MHWQNTRWLLDDQLKNAGIVRKFHVYTYQHIELLDLMPLATSVLKDMPGRDDLMNTVKDVLSSAGWEGDGQLQLMWLPPFVSPGHGDNMGNPVWFVKQSNNGTAFMASPSELSFDGLHEERVRR